jgi:hypothetical protein
MLCSKLQNFHSRYSQTTRADSIWHGTTRNRSAQQGWDKKSIRQEIKVEASHNRLTFIMSNHIFTFLSKWIRVSYTLEDCWQGLVIYLPTKVQNTPTSRPEWVRSSTCMYIEARPRAAGRHEMWWILLCRIPSGTRNSRARASWHRGSMWVTCSEVDACTAPWVIAVEYKTRCSPSLLHRSDQTHLLCCTICWYSP